MRVYVLLSRIAENLFMEFQTLLSLGKYRSVLYWFTKIYYFIKKCMILDQDFAQARPMALLIIAEILS